MAGDTETMADRRQRLERAVAAYLEAVDAGHTPDPDRWLARYPELQPELAEFLADQAHLDRLVGPLRPAAAGCEGDTTQSLNGSAAPAEAQGPLYLNGHVNDVVAVAFSRDGRRLATAAWRSTQGGCEVKLRDPASGRNLVTWTSLDGIPLDMAFEPDGRRLRVLQSDSSNGEARIVLFDASPLVPEVEAIDIVDRLDGNVPLNSELAARIEAELGLDPAVRAAALAAVPLRQESVFHLTSAASSWLGAADRTPEVTRRALAYAERADALVRDRDLAILGEARYRNGLLTECLEPLRRALALQEQDNRPDEFRNCRRSRARTLCTVDS
jgi:hypothetical protein